MKNKLFQITIILCLVPSLLLEGCAMTAVAVGTAAGTTILLTERRTTGTIVEDKSIELKAMGYLMAKGEPGQKGHINVNCYNGAVLLTGEVPNEEARKRAAEIVSKIEKVTRVYNEIRIAAPSAYFTRGSDSYITSKLKTKLLASRNTVPARIKVVTENGTVYLMGLVKEKEAKEAVQITRTTGGVQRVVNLFEHVAS